MYFTVINARIEGIRDNDEEISKFTEEYKPFIASCAEKVAGRYMSYGSDDELSIAMMAFVEAIKSFDKTKGNFFAFSKNVIKKRLIDYYRKEKRHSNVISLNMYLEDKDEEFDLSSSDAIREFSENRIREFRKLELEELAKELQKYNITYTDLAKSSPKHERTKRQCSEIAGIILSRPDMLEQILIKKYMPVLEIEKASGLPRKLIERYRKYIIAMVVIATGDYDYIRDYIKL